MAAGRDAAARLQQAWLGRGALARALWPLSVVFGGAVALRRLLYRVWLRPAPLRVPVVVVGNLIAGGAGKTPTVLAVVELLRRHGFRPGIVSRGYGRAAAGVHEVSPGDAAEQSGDEPLLLRIRGRVPVVVGRSRALAAQRLLALHPDVDVIVSDDGLQHLALHRDLSLVVFDERGAGNGWLLPAGPLREPLPRLGDSGRESRRWVLYNAERATTRLPGTLIARTLSGPVALADWWRGAAAPPGDWQQLAGRPLVAAAGIARPQRFFAMLRAQGLSFKTCALPDHHPWRELPWEPSTADAVITEKDAVKLRPGENGTVGATRVWVAPLDFRPDAGLESELIAALAELAALRDSRTRKPDLTEDADGHPPA